eukprot:CAMPEP_0113949706 /NCGR_PEP_ID=MMETSP1339-20121228/77133_1 /TAXON_ID=94617 /ORGANISM="Fibrocapsa japonica" /LENGTH=272 /DNA_ID=CAMNT_0000957263 /DNA_START=128 /DNA_END=946 /DNA_ORIENTATION=+ /assembly_acc=CAM_ASM_000762
MVPALFMNLYITGLNQITDIEIDKINKPTLPIPAGDLSKNMAIGIVTVSLALSIVLGYANPTFCTGSLRTVLYGSAILGTMYSLPPFRLKRFPLLAALSIIGVRGSLVNVCFFAHALQAGFKESLGSSLWGLPFVNAKCAALTAFFGVFGIVIALMKDVPDLSGDKEFNIPSFTVQFGQTKVFKVARRVMSGLFFSSGALLLYLASTATAAAASASVTAARGLLGLGAITVGQWVRQKAQKVNCYDQKEVYGFYMFLWKLFYASYLVIPFAR